MLVHGAQELGGARLLVAADAGVVPRCNEVRSTRKGAVCKGAKLDGLVAHHVGVGCEAVRVGVHQVVHNGALVLLLAVPDLEANAQGHSNALGVRKVVGPGAAVPRQVARPVAHVDGRDVVALLNKERGRERRVHASGEAEKDLLAH